MEDDTVTSEISLASIDSSYTDVTATASDFTGNGNTIPKANVDLKFIKSVQAYTGMRDTVILTEKFRKEADRKQMKCFIRMPEQR